MSELIDVEVAAASERRLLTHPDDVVALNIAALGALRRSDSIRARELLERAMNAAPEDCRTYHNLARLCESEGDFGSALAADQFAVQLEPASAILRLHYAIGLERLGNQDRALLHFLRAMREAQSRGEWATAASTPLSLRPLVQHAVEAIRHGQRALYHQLLAPLIARYGRASLARIFAAIRVYVGEQPPNYPDTRQRPTFFYVPGVRPAPYFDSKMFAWVGAYEQRCAEIRGELEALLLSTRGRERVFDSEALERENLRGNILPPTWNGYYFYRHGERREDNSIACPATAAGLDSISLIRIPGHGPEALFSVFTPGTHLLPHRGVTNARAVCHLPIIVPPDCALRVGGEVREWREGRTLIFDDTYEHEAWNRSPDLRVVLIADVWNPHLTEVERAAVSDLIGAIGDLRGSIDGI